MTKSMRGIEDPQSRHLRVRILVLATLLVLGGGTWFGGTALLKPKPLPAMKPRHVAPPSAATTWLDPPNANGVYAINFDAPCQELLLGGAPLVLKQDVTAVSNKPSFDRVATSVEKLLDHVNDELYVANPNSRTLFRVEPNLRTREMGFDDARSMAWEGNEGAYRELLVRSLPWEGIVAIDQNAQMRFYAIQESLDVATERLLDRVGVLAPRVACGHNHGRRFGHQPDESTAALGPEQHGWRTIVAHIKMFEYDVSGDRTFTFYLRRVKEDDATLVVTTLWDPSGFSPPWEKLDALEPIFKR